MKAKWIVLLLSMFMVFTYNPYLQAQDEEEEEDTSTGPGRYGEDSVTCVLNISLYHEFYKQWKASGYKNAVVKDAIGPWRWVFLNCPKGTQNAYIDGVKIVSWLIENAKDEKMKEAYIDTLMMVYDQRIQYFNKEGYVLGRKGVDMYKYRPQAYEEVYNALSRSIELEGNKTAAPVLVYYFRSVISMVKNGKADTALIVEAYDLSTGIIDHNIKKYAGQQKKIANWEIVQGNIELSFEPYATCDDLIPVFTKKFEQNPDDLDLLKKITTMLDKKKCQESDLYFQTSQKLYDLEPSPESAYLLGKMLLKEGDFDKAIEYFKEVEGVEDQEILARAYKYMAEAYRAKRSLQTAKNFALKALSINSNDGELYIILGDLYAEGAKECGDNELTQRVAYWAAVDKYAKAKQVDPEVADIANKRIAAYSIYFPSLETIFFYNLKEGDQYTVECWINETTTVRASK